MSITEFSVKNYQFTLIVFIAMIAIGLSSLLNMPRGEDPEFTAPNVVVVYVYPGTGPKDMEQLVVNPVEKKINELEDVKLIRSTIDDGLAVIRIEFNYSADPDKKYQDVLRELNALKNELPSDILDTRIIRFTPTTVSILQVGLTSEVAPYSQLEEQSNKLKDELSKLKSLSEVRNWAYPKQQVKVAIHLDKLAFYKIPLNRVFGAIQSENVNIPGGSIDMGSKKLNVRTSSEFKNIEDVEKTIVSSSGTKIIYLRDIADVKFDYEDETYKARLNGKRAVWVTASQKAKQNIFAIDKEMEPILKNFEKQLPSHIKMTKSFDQAAGVKGRLTGFMTDFIIAITLVLLTLLPLGLRASFVVMISIPLSLAIGLFCLDKAGFTINQLSIVGMVLALGLLVDDSIVVVENIERYLRMGFPPRKAAILATQQISLAVIGCTMTLVFSFLPLLFLPEASGDFIRCLPAAVLFTVGASLLVSLTIVPFLSSLILSSKHDERGNLFMRGLKRLIGGSYKKVLHLALIHPWKTLGVAALIFASSLVLAKKLGTSLFPASEKPQFLVNIETPLGTNLQETDKVCRYAESVVSRVSNLKSIAANIGRGNPRIYYNTIQAAESTNYAQLFVQLDGVEPKEKRRIIDSLRGAFNGYANAKIQVKDFEQGPDSEAPIAIRIFGESQDTLRSLSFKIEEMIRTTPGTIYINNPQTSQNTDLKIKINKEKAGLLGVPTSEIDKMVRFGLAGLNISKFRRETGDDFSINVSLPNKGDKPPTIETFDGIYVNSVTGTSIPLSELASIEFQTSPTIIQHFDKVRFTTITAFAKTGFLTQTINNSLAKNLADFRFPSGYGFEVAGEEESKKKSFGGLAGVIIITIFGILGVLILEFKTFRSTLVVLSVIPLGVIGAVLALWATGETFSFVAIVGLIALSGIEVKNTILLVDFTQQLREQGKTLDEAIQEAGEIRFVPIILTTLTAIGGMIPLALENNPLYSPLAFVMIGGLITSTLLTRIVMPVVYKLLAPKVSIKEQGELIA
jgi:multidrug efflux pump subunit AcrB